MSTLVTDGIAVISCCRRDAVERGSKVDCVEMSISMSCVAWSLKRSGLRCDCYSDVVNCVRTATANRPSHSHSHSHSYSHSQTQAQTQTTRITKWNSHISYKKWWSRLVKLAYRQGRGGLVTLCHTPNLPPCRYASLPRRDQHFLYKSLVWSSHKSLVVHLHSRSFTVKSHSHSYSHS